MVGIGHEGTPGELVMFIPNLGFMGMSLGEFKELYLTIYTLFCMYVILLYPFYQKIKRKKKTCFFLGTLMFLILIQRLHDLRKWKNL